MTWSAPMTTHVTTSFKRKKGEGVTCTLAFPAQPHDQSKMDRQEDRTQQNTRKTRATRDAKNQMRKNTNAQKHKGTKKQH
jgi:hypothetical protein